MKKNISIQVLMLCALFAHAQTIQVLDKITRQSLPGVVVYSYNPSHSTLTDSKGQTGALPFKTADSIRFKIINYKPAVYTYQQLEGNKFKVELDEGNISLNEIVVSANRWEENKIENPNRVEKINMKEVNLQNPQTTADLLGSGSSVYIQKSQQAGGSPMIRGFATNRVMIVVDGVRMNNAIFRSGNVQNVISIDANALDGAEVLFGPGAVMYGSDAIGGVMDFHTRAAQLADTNKILVKVNALGRYSTANKENTVHLDFNIGLKKLAFTSSISYSKYNDLWAGSQGGHPAYLRPFYQVLRNDKDTQVVNNTPSLQVNSKYSQINFMQKIRFVPTKKLSVDYAFHLAKSGDAPRYDRLTTDANSDGLLDFSEWYYGPQIWDMQRLAMQHEGNGKVYSNLRVILAYQHFEESRHDRKMNASGSKTSGNARLRHQYEMLDALSLNVDLDKKAGDKTTLFYGAEAIYNIVGSRSNRINVYTNVDQALNPRYPDGSTWKTSGAYASIKHRLSDKMIANAGMRYTLYAIQAVFDTSLFKYPMTEAKMNKGAINGSLGLVYTPVGTWQLYINASTGFRAPNIDDAGKVFDSQPGKVVVPNPSLKPEYAYSAESGTAKVFGNFLKFDLSFYYTYLTDALVRRPFILNGEDSIMYNGALSGVEALQNASHAIVYGLQSGIEMYFGHGISLRSNISWQVGREQNLDSARYFPLTHSAPLFGNIHLQYARKKIKTDFYIMYNGKMEYEDLALSEREEPYIYARSMDGKPFVPAWYTLNFKIAFYMNKYLALNAGIENIADRLYRPYSSGISAPGRNFCIAIRGSF